MTAASTAYARVLGRVDLVLVAETVTTLAVGWILTSGARAFKLNLS